MSKAYLYIQFKIKEIGAFQQYAQTVAATVSLYGGKTIAVNKTPSALHGELDIDMSVIQEWPSIKAAQTWLDSPEYAPLKRLRDEHAMEKLLITPVQAVDNKR
ncbi:DUF1330 domain-containing protein [Vibrio coralliilyticus]|uniref:DUF1330 domain-containing protein n=1 Tax=Vibrio coralliilyticus TaxID=190893 RepID=UPI00240A3BEF|nr:DUF1330 domain-containing protein [Vibrio coralliilyticus]WFB49474.1 DUF1330 domain-containing protein [Vibrio coralliilyticus]